MGAPENRWAGLCNIVLGPRGLMGTLRNLLRELYGPHFLIQGGGGAEAAGPRKKRAE